MEDRLRRCSLSPPVVRNTHGVVETGFRNHNDAWTLRPSPARAALREWVADPH